MARTIDRPMGLRGTFYRIKIIEMTTWGERIDRGYHKQPFRTRDEAEAAIWTLGNRLAKAGRSADLHVVEFRGV